MDEPVCLNGRRRREWCQKCIDAAIEEEMINAVSEPEDPEDYWHDGQPDPSATPTPVWLESLTPSECMIERTRPGECVEIGCRHDAKVWAHWQVCALHERSGQAPAEKAAFDRKHRHRRRALRHGAEIAGPVSRETYEEIMASGVCVYCGGEATSVDHVRSLHNGGAEHVDNLVPACSPCNSCKGKKLLTEWNPERVAYAIRTSPVVLAEWNRLTGGEQTDV